MSTWYFWVFPTTTNIFWERKSVFLSLIDERLVSIMSTIKAIYGDRVSKEYNAYWHFHSQGFDSERFWPDFFLLLFLSFLRVKSVKNEWGRWEMKHICVFPCFYFKVSSVQYMTFSYTKARVFIYRVSKKYWAKFLDHY